MIIDYISLIDMSHHLLIDINMVHIILIFVLM